MGSGSATTDANTGRGTPMFGQMNAMNLGFGVDFDVPMLSPH